LVWQWPAFILASNFRMPISSTTTGTVRLKDTGQKVAHLEKQLRGRERNSEELSRRMAEQE
jgi:hypothetical protein